MKFSIITLFPKMFDAVLGESIIKNAQKNGLITVETHDLRNFTEDKHRTVDDTPYGGGTGMLLKVDVMDRAISSIKSEIRNPKSEDDVTSEINNQKSSRSDNPTTILLSPQGEKFTSKMAKELAQKDHLVLICGHYEGFDERIREHLVDRQISIGDYVLTGGELPTMVLVDAISRFVPDVLPEGAPDEDSHSLEVDGKSALEYPQYTKPADYNGWKVPDVLLSGNHAEIAKWKNNNLKI